ncbi:MAG: S49 family peptidase [Candidatus Pacebacteria bacterium]|nr:S49 family peptidase [Candidatus Paceibacterota bacterium]
MLSTPAKIVLGIMALCLIVAAASSFWGASNSSCNVAYIPIHGEMVTYIPASDSASSSNPQDFTASQDVTNSIRSAAADSSIKAIVLEIDSPGGDPVAGEEIEDALKLTDKPSVALIRSEGASAAYMAASGANTIFASEFSDVGSIGITESYSDQAQQDAASGITYNQLSIGKYKDMFSPDKPLTADERALALSQLQIMYQDFVDIVAQNRGLSTSSVLTLSDGAVMTGEQAIKAGLVDQLGTVDDVRSFLTKKIGSDAVICGIDTN